MRKRRRRFGLALTALVLLALAIRSFPLYLNLPQAEKDADPDYGDATADTLPTAEHGGATVTTVIGEGSPISLHTPMQISMPPWPHTDVFWPEVVRISVRWPARNGRRVTVHCG